MNSETKDYLLTNVTMCIRSPNGIINSVCLILDSDKWELLSRSGILPGVKIGCCWQYFSWEKAQDIIATVLYFFVPVYRSFIVKLLAWMIFKVGLHVSKDIPDPGLIGPLVGNDGALALLQGTHARLGALSSVRRLGPHHAQLLCQAFTAPTHFGLNINGWQVLVPLDIATLLTLPLDLRPHLPEDYLL